MLCSVPLQTGPIINEANGHTYYLLEASTWTEAEAAAKELGGNLVTINDAAEDVWVRETFGDSNQFGLWTGLNDQQTEGEFVWTSGEPVTYTNWASGQPDNYNGEEDFVMLYTDDGGRWADYSDRETTAGRPLQGVVEIPSFINPANGHTYIKLSPSTWTEAEARSVELGGHLVTINDVAEQEWVFETFSDDSQFGLWIGLNDRNQEGEFVWSSGQPVTYTNWGSEQPDNFNGAEDYAMMFVEDSGAWYDFPDYAYEGGTTGRPLHGITEYEGIRNKETGEIIAGTELIPPGPCINADGWDLQNANLAGRNLRRSSLVNADLSRASFSNATLTEAKLSQADLGGANFSNATLTDADFSSADLSGAGFYNATLTATDFSTADLSNADFSNATLTETNLSDAVILRTRFVGTTDRGFTAEQLYSTTSYQEKDLTGIQLGGNDLTGWDFRGQNLANAHFGFATLTDADFSSADLSWADFSNATLTATDFSTADLSGAGFSYATLTEANLSDAVITRASFAQTTDRGFTAEQLYSTKSYQEKDLTGIQLESNDLTGWDFQGQNLANAYFGFATLTDADLSQANLAEARFYNATLTATNFSSADLSGAGFSNATLTAANLSDAVITRASFAGTTERGFTAEQLYSTKSFQDKELANIGLSYNDLTGWNFGGQNLSGAFLGGTNLTDSDLSLADLTRASFYSADLIRADLSDANLTDAGITRASFADAKGFTAAQLYSTASYQSKDLMKIDLSGLDLTGWDFHGQNLLSASFRDSDLTDAIITGASLWDTTDLGFTAEQLYSTLSYKNQNLVRIGLGNNDLTGWSFGGQDLTGAKFWRANLTGSDFSQADLPYADFSHANLTDASFSQANLPGADCERANLTDADLSQANLWGVTFSGATLAGADLRDSHIPNASFIGTTSGGFTAEQLYSTASYKLKDLRGIGLSKQWSFEVNDLTGWSFRDQDLTSASFSGAILIDADFTNAITTGTSFSGTTENGFTAAKLYSTWSYQNNDLTKIGLGYNDLTGWSFRDQDLTSASFSGAILIDADFADAVITGANFSNSTEKGLTEAQLYATSSYQNKSLANISFYNNDLTGWNFRGQDLSRASLWCVDFTNSDLSQSNLTDVSLWIATLMGTDLTDAIITGASFSGTTDLGFTAAQLYSTKSYQNKSLAGVIFGAEYPSTLIDNDLTGWNFHGQDLSGASFRDADLTDADFSLADLTGASFGEVAGPYYPVTTLTRANLSGAVVTRANFNNTTANGFTRDQLYSTASYQDKNLLGIELAKNDLSSWDFHGQNMSNALLDGSELRNANFDSTDLTGASVRYAANFVPSTTTTTRSTVWPDGRVNDLVLQENEIWQFLPKSYESIFLMDYVIGRKRVAIAESFEMSEASALELRIGVYLDDPDGEYPLGPRLSLADQTQVSLDGTLRIKLLDPLPNWFPNPYEEDSFYFFDWPSPLDPNNVFTVVEVPAGAWDLSELYTAGSVRFVARYVGGGDFNVDGKWTATDIDQLAISLRGGRDESYDVTDDGILDEADHLAWVEEIAGTRLGDSNLDQTIDFSDFLNLSGNFGESGGWAEGDFNADGEIDFADFLILSRNYGWEASAAIAEAVSGRSAAPNIAEKASGDSALVARALAAESDPVSELADQRDEIMLNELVPEAVKRRNLADTVFADGSVFLSY